MRDVLFVILSVAFASSSSSDSSLFWFHLVVDARRVAAMTKNMVRSSERRVLPRLAELKSSPSPATPPLDRSTARFFRRCLFLSFLSLLQSSCRVLVSDEKGVLQ
jgi:hypothetical protein